MPPHSYQQPEKQIVRESVLTRAVQVLTSERRSAPLALPDGLLDTVEFGTVESLSQRGIEARVETT